MANADFLSDVSAERAILAGVFAHGSEVYDDVADLVTVNSFTVDSNQTIFRCFQHLFKEQQDVRPDFPTLLGAANALGLSQAFEGRDEIAHLRAIINFPVRKENVRKLAAKVRKLEVARTLACQLDQAKATLGGVTGDEPIDAIIGLVENPIFELTSLLASSNEEGPQPIGQGIRDYVQFLENNKREMVGISTGYPNYDRAIGGGLRNGTVNLIGARPKAGKTAWADNVSIHVAGKLDIPVLNLDTEMSKEDHWNRMLANLTGVCIDDIETGKFPASKRTAINLAIDKLEKMPYDYLSIAGWAFEDIISTARRWVTRKVGRDKPCLIIYDYLKLMSSEVMQNKTLAEFQALGFMMTSLHNFTVRWKIPCLAFVQLNRDGINREDTDVVSQSDRLIWLCSNFSIFKAKSDEEIAQSPDGRRYNRKLVPIVCRHGAGLEDGDYINVAFQRHLARMTEGPTKLQLSATAAGGRNAGIVVGQEGFALPR